MTVTIFLASALICIADQCHPALVGRATPVGSFPLVQRFVQARGYGGDVLQFADTPTGLLAIHRVWLGRPAQRRAQRLASGDAGQRRDVTDGCVNVMPAVYEAILGASEIEIRP